MSKKLSEMTFDELWRLCPIFLTEHKPYWAEWFEEEKVLLTRLVPCGAEIYHIGSTAIEGIWAKPIIDILIVVGDLSELKETANVLEKRGYIKMSTSGNRISLNKGYTEQGFAERVFHIHIRLNGDMDEIYFRNHLNAHPETAKEYEKLKLRLWKEFEFNRDAYTDAKTEFVRKYTEIEKRKLCEKTL